MKITNNQLRAARALLNLTQEDVSERSGVAIDSIKKFESGSTKKLQQKSEDALFRAFSDRIEFLDNEGLRLKPQGIETYEGSERFEEFYNFMYEHLEQHGGDVCLNVVNEKLFREYRKDFEHHKQRMKALVESGKINFRVLATESYFKSTWAQYRWQPRQSASPIAFYAFGDCLALVSFDHNPPPYVVLHKSGPFAAAYRASFDIAWDQALPPPEQEE